MPRKGFHSVTISDVTHHLVVELAEEHSRSKAWVIEKAVKHFIAHPPEMTDNNNTGGEEA